jgi:hypothetical protein
MKTIIMIIALIYMALGLFKYTNSVYDYGFIMIGFVWLGVYFLVKGVVL